MNHACVPCPWDYTSTEANAKGPDTECVKAYTNLASEHHCIVEQTAVDPLDFDLSVDQCDSGCEKLTAESTMYQAYAEGCSNGVCDYVDVEAERLQLFEFGNNYEMEFGLQYYPIDVPRGAKIVNARLQFHVTASDGEKLVANIRAEKGFPKAFPGTGPVSHLKKKKS